MLQIPILREIFNKILMQCLHSRYANITQVWSYNCNETKLICIDANITPFKTLKRPKNGKHEFNATAYAKETQVRCICYSLTSRDPFWKLFSLDTMPCVHWVSFCCCNHLSSTLMSVKLMVIQLELNAIAYELVFIIIQSLHQTHDMH
jgi:hypothetical protein